MAVLNLKKKFPLFKGPACAEPRLRLTSCLHAKVCFGTQTCGQALRHRQGLGGFLVKAISSKFKFFFLLHLISSIILCSNLSAQSPMTPKLKEFLTRNDFMELIEKYGQDDITLTIKGVEQKKIEQRSYNIAQGYRCQVFASADIANAEEVASRIETLKLDSVYVISSEDGLYKVQVGNYQERKQAQIMLDKLMYAGVNGVWIIETSIHVPKARHPQEPAQVDMKSGFYYTVQVFNTKYAEKAQRFKSTLEQRFAEPVTIIQQDDLWKVVVGRFDDHESASALLERMHDEGFIDAWITQVVN